MEGIDEMRERLLDFALSVIKLGEEPVKTTEARRAVAQVIRSGTNAAIVYCRAELAMVRPDHSEGLWRALGSLKEAETLVEKIAQQTNARGGRNQSFERICKELRELVEIKIRTAMEEICGEKGLEARDNG